MNILDGSPIPLFKIDGNKDISLHPKGIEFLENQSKVKSFTVVLSFKSRQSNNKKIDHKSQTIDFIHVVERDMNVLVFNLREVSFEIDSIRTLIGLLLQISSLCTIDEAYWPRGTKNKVPVGVLDIFDIFLKSMPNQSNANTNMTDDNVDDNASQDNLDKKYDGKRKTRNNNSSSSSSISSGKKIDPFEKQLDQITSGLKGVLPPVVFTLDSKCAHNFTNDLITLSGFISHVEPSRSEESSYRNRLRSILNCFFPSYSSGVVDFEESESGHKRDERIVRNVLKGNVNHILLAARSFDGVCLSSYLLVDLLKQLCFLTRENFSNCLTDSMSIISKSIRTDVINYIIEDIMINANNDMNRLSSNFEDISEHFRSIRRRALTKLRGYFSEISDIANKSKKQLQLELRKMKRNRESILASEDISKLQKEIDDHLEHTFDFLDDIYAEEETKNTITRELLESGISHLTKRLDIFEKSSILGHGYGWDTMKSSLNRQIIRLYSSCNSWVQRHITKYESVDHLISTLEEEASRVNNETDNIQKEVQLEVAKYSSNNIHTDGNTNGNSLSDGNNSPLPSPTKNAQNLLGESSSHLLARETEAFERLLETVATEENELMEDLLNVTKELDEVNQFWDMEHTETTDYHSKQETLLRKLKEIMNIESQLVPDIIRDTVSRVRSTLRKKETFHNQILEQFNQSIESYRTELDVLNGRYGFD